MRGGGGERRTSEKEEDTGKKEGEGRCRERRKGDGRRDRWRFEDRQEKGRRGEEKVEETGGQMQRCGEGEREGTRKEESSRDNHEQTRC